MSNILYRNLSYKIVGFAFEVHRTLGPGFLENVYENALAIELDNAGVKFERQKCLDVYYKNIQVGHYIADLVIENKIILELKAIRGTISDVHKAQAMNYLSVTGYDLALILNFGTQSLERQRVANSRKLRTK